MTPGMPICYRCVHRHGEIGTPLITCDAYPDKIPFEIIMSEIDHHFPYKGDHGIQFKERNARDMPKVIPFPHPVIG